MIRNTNEHHLCVSGTRNYTDYQTFAKIMERETKDMRIKLIISGGAKGADEMAKRYAQEKNITHITVHADWQRWGRRAGPMRNRLMAEMTNATIAFWDGRSRGTKNMLECAEKEKHEYITYYDFERKISIRM